MEQYSYGILFIVLGTVFLFANIYLLASDYKWLFTHVEAESKKRTYLLGNLFLFLVAIAILAGGIYYLFTVHSQLI